MTPPKGEVSMEHRMTTVELLLEAHVKSCDKSSNEIKWWVRAIGLVVALGLLRAVAIAAHIPIG